MTSKFNSQHQYKHGYLLSYLFVALVIVGRLNAQTSEIIDTCGDKTTYPHWTFTTRIYCEEGLPGTGLIPPLDGLELDYPGITGVFYIYQNYDPNNAITGVYPEQTAVQITVSYRSTVDLVVDNVRTPDGGPGIIVSEGLGWTTRRLEVDVQGVPVIFRLDLSTADFANDFFLLDNITITFEGSSTSGPDPTTADTPSTVSEGVQPTTEPIPTTEMATTPAPPSEHLIDGCEDSSKYPTHWYFDPNFPCSEDLPADELPELDDLELDYEGLTGLFYVHNANYQLVAHYPAGDEDDRRTVITLTYYSTVNLTVTGVVTSDGGPGIIETPGVGWTERSFIIENAAMPVAFLLDLTSALLAAGPDDFFLLDKILVTFEYEQPETESPTTTLDPTTTEVPSSTVEPPSSTPVVTVTTEAPITTTPGTTTTLTPGCPFCNATDKYGVRYVACERTHAKSPCPQDSRGLASWYCLSQNNFNGSQPDYSDCGSRWLDEIRDQISDGNPINSTNATELLQKMHQHVFDAANPEIDLIYFGHEIKLLYQLGTSVLMLVDNNVTVPVLENLTGVAMNIFSQILTFDDPWEELSPVLRSEAGTTFISSCELSSINLATRQKQINNTSARYRKGFVDLQEFEALAGMETIKLIGNRITFPEEYNSKADSFIEIPTNWADYFPIPANTYTTFSGVGLSSERANKLFPAAQNSFRSPSPTALLNSRMLSFTFSEPNSRIRRPVVEEERRLNLTRGAGVKLTFQHDTFAWGEKREKIRRKLHDGERAKAVQGSALCAYFNVDTLKWSTEGCTLVSSGRDASTCECNHLTSFAIIMDVHDYVGKDLGLEILTLVLCPISIVSLIICIVTFMCSSQSKRQSLATISPHPRNELTLNLCLALLLANILILVTVDRNYLYLSDGACIGTAIVLHYTLLLAFSWMALEGLLLARLVFIDIYSSGYEYVYRERLAAYLIPAIIVGTTVAINFGNDDHGYGNDSYCWLNGGYIWSFLGPIALVVIFNTVILGMALRRSYFLQVNPRSKVKREAKSLSFWVRGSMSLSSIMGATWIFGFFMFINNSTFANIAAYFFTFFNASQGILIFVFHVALNEKLRKRFSIFTSSSRNESSTSDTATFGRSHERTAK